MGSTNYSSTFIRVATDCPVESGEEPPTRGAAPSVAALQYELASRRPYVLTSDDLLFEVHAIRRAIPADARAAERDAFFAKSQACLRASPLAKRYGWGIHHDADGHIALVPLGTDEYRVLADDPTLTQLTAMRSKRA
ncbi:hypothetical protein F8O01_14435 [Pseudoclavibacter chungangensis]|uniref:Uncharacterized protein n=1 Tax=Pseudoclavibacter chungangensis TaxID=587635 RepID=A0A7J5BNI1_9MICO|nr:DUF6157 family protein [Pseudoclavibacter chungangensis]KAB1653820.1 hypothetical protein F8O01_14435 [Pseudoclavibacter chungangensis]NYJ68170.1 hypothetical protein [Pseudoclavibacter chungangensis]